MKDVFFTPKFRKTVLKEYEKGNLTIEKLAKKHGISKSVIFKWRKTGTQKRKRFIKKNTKENVESFTDIMNKKRRLNFAEEENHEVFQLKRIILAMLKERYLK